MVYSVICLTVVDVVLFRVCKHIHHEGIVSPTSLLTLFEMGGGGA